MESSKCAHFGFGSSLSVCCCCCAFNSSRSKFMTYFSVHSKDNSFLWWHRLSFFMFCCRFACRFYLSFDTMLTGVLYIPMPMNVFFTSHFLLLHNKRHFSSISKIFAFFFSRDFPIFVIFPKDIQINLNEIQQIEKFIFHFLLHLYSLATMNTTKRSKIKLTYNIRTANNLERKIKKKQTKLNQP